MSTPRTLIEPEVGVSTPSSIDNVVVLPAPLPPSSAVVVPCRTAKEMPLTASTLPYDLRRSATTMAAATELIRAPSPTARSALNGLPAELRELAHHGRAADGRLRLALAVFHAELE